jgi:hypothetical protein
MCLSRGIGWLPVLLGFFSAALGQSCTGLCLQQVSCPSGEVTTISGTVYAPNGADPLPNVVVYIPNGPVEAFTPGVSCPAGGQEPQSGSPLVETTTAVDGTFRLFNVPVGANIPLVIQLGRWRRQVVVATTTACTDTAFSTRMPKNQGEGDIPRIALVTGKTDKMECALRDFGIDDAEFTNPGGTGRVNLYVGANNPGAQIDAQTPNENALMGSASTLNQYDDLMLASQGSADGAVPGPSKSIGAPSFIPDGGLLPQPAAENLSNFASFVNAGGRAYLSHLEYVYLDGNPYLPALANWSPNDPNPSTYLGNNNQFAPVDTSFAEGQQFAEWLELTNPTPTEGQIELENTYSDVTGVIAPTQSWVALGASSYTPGVQQLVAHTPVGAANACGRVVFNDYLEEAPVNMDYPKGVKFPLECEPRFQSSQEQALEFDVFELTDVTTTTSGAATLTPAYIDFGSQPLGFATAAKALTWTNPSSSTVTAYVSMGPGDFNVVSNDCSAVAAGGSCQISVDFKPSALGPRSANLSVYTAGTIGPTSAFFTGVGVAALSLSATELQFYNHKVGTSTTLSLTVTNIAPGPVAFPGMVVTGDYAATTNCGSAIAATSSCTIYVTFTPTTGGLRSGTLTVGSSPVVGLEGVGDYFTMTASPDSGSVEAGLGITANVVVTPEFGYTGYVRVSCTTTAPATTCSGGVASLSGTSAVTVQIAMKTTSKFAVVGYSGFGGRGLLWLVGAGTGLLLWTRRRRVGRVARAGVMVALLGVLGFAASGCSGMYPAENQSYTPAGSYTVTLSGTDGFLVETGTYTLNVTAP